LLHSSDDVGWAGSSGKFMIRIKPSYPNERGGVVNR
jgi:hypothetical protein